MEAAVEPPTNYQQKYEQLLAEKIQIEAEFGVKRSQFRKIYLECEGQLRNEKELSQQLQIQVQDITKKMDSFKSEAEGIRIAAQLSEESKHEEYVALNVKHQEEIASLRHIWEEASKENQARLARDYEAERRKLLEANSKLEQRIRNEVRLNEEPANSEGIMSIMSNAFSRKTSGTTPPKLQSTDGATSLEGDQQQAQHDVVAWKNVVSPLEKEIENLKSQLADAKKRLNEKPLSNDQELKETKKYLDSERSARTDLEMYVAVLNTQKGVLQEDADKLRHELHNVCRMLEQEKMNHTELKQTWKLANEQFLEQQNNLIFENNKMKRMLTPQQLEQLSRDVRLERENLASSTHKNNSGEPGESTSNDANFDEFLNSFEPESMLKKDDQVDGLFMNKTSLPKDLKDTPDSNSKMGKRDQMKVIGENIFNSLFPSAHQAKQFADIMKDGSAIQEKPLMLSLSSESEDEDDLESAIMKQNVKKYGLIELAEEANEPLVSTPTSASTISSVLKKSSSSDNILRVKDQQSLMEKSLSHGDVSVESNITMSNSYLYNDEIDKKLSLNETGWSTASIDYGRTCMMCQNYEKQLQRLQKECNVMITKETSAVNATIRLEEQLNSEKEKIKTLEKSVESAVGDTQSQMNIYRTNQVEVDKQVELLRKQLQLFQNDIVNEMKCLSGCRDDNPADVQTPTLNDVDSLRNTYEQTEEKLKGEIMFLKDRAKTEQFDRESTENVLQQDLNAARQELVQLKHELEKHKECTKS